MIDKQNFKALFEKEKLIYPKNLKIHEKQTLNFSSAENMVVFEAVYQLLNKGYKPEHIELEPKINSIKIPIPPLSKQKALIDEVEKLEAKINQAKTIIEGAKERKEKIMEKYL